MEDYYEILEVSPRASPEVIQRAHRVLAMKYHPDRQPAEKRAWAEQMMRRLNEAYRVVSDPAARAAYDAGRAVSVGQATVGVAEPRAPAIEVPVVCAFHPTRAATSVCMSCARPLCPECATLQGGSVVCVDCAAAPVEEKARVRRPKPSYLAERRGTAGALATILWIGSIVLCGALAGIVFLAPALGGPVGMGGAIGIGAIVGAIGGALFSLALALTVPLRVRYAAAVGGAVGIGLCVATLWHAGEKGTAQLKEGERAQAAFWLSVAESVRGQDTSRLVEVGKVWMGEGHLDRAIGCFEGARELAPKGYEVNMALGRAYLQRGKKAREGILGLALKGAQDITEAYRGLLSGEEEIGEAKSEGIGTEDFKRALARVDDALQARPQDADATKLRQEISEEMQRPETSEQSPSAKWWEME